MVKLHCSNQSIMGELYANISEGKFTLLYPVYLFKDIFNVDSPISSPNTCLWDYFSFHIDLG